MPKKVFITGGTGYIGRELIPALTARGHSVRALVRAGSESRLPPGVEPIKGSPLKAETFASAIAPYDTLVHLVGVPHPSPLKAKQFREIDLVAAQQALSAARSAGIRHFVFLSVAMPAPTMQAYIAVRQEAETLITQSKIPATFVRPWYVLGPGHRWPYFVLPLYWILERLPWTKASAQRLGFVTIGEMTQALVHVIENPPSDVRIFDVPMIRRYGRTHG